MKVLLTLKYWIRDKEHGLQFKATMKTVSPTTTEGTPPSLEVVIGQD